MYKSKSEYSLTANTYFIRVLYNLCYQGKRNLSAENNSNCQETNLPSKFKMVVLICCFIYFIYIVPFDYVSQEFGSIVSERFNTEKTHMQFSHELL